MKYPSRAITQQIFPHPFPQTPPSEYHPHPSPSHPLTSTRPIGAIFDCSINGFELTAILFRQACRLIITILTSATTTSTAVCTSRTWCCCRRCANFSTSATNSPASSPNWRRRRTKSRRASAMTTTRRNASGGPPTKSKDTTAVPSRPASAPTDRRAPSTSTSKSNIMSSTTNSIQEARIHKYFPKGPRKIFRARRMWASKDDYILPLFNQPSNSSTPKCSRGRWGPLVESAAQLWQQFYKNKTVRNKMFNASKVGEVEQTKTKRSYSYQDITKLEAKNLYSSMGKMIESRKPTSNRATFGKAERKETKKVLEPFRMAEIDNIGKESKGPGAYLPPRHVLANGELIETKDPTEKMKYPETASYKFGKSEKKGLERERYNYMNYKNDELEVDKADLKRRNSTPAILIGTKERFPDERADKITPGPTYDPTLKPDVPAAPKFTLGSRRAVKGQDPLVPPTSTTNLVGPGTYFQKVRSQSTGDLLRVPVTSTIKNEPAVTFAKGPKFLAQYKASVDETYDLKTKTMMAHYDFQYDAGKGLHSGLSYMKKNIINSSERPLQKNKMKSYTMAVASREKQQKRGTFISMMSNTPAPVRMNHPKF